MKQVNLGFYRMVLFLLLGLFTSVIAYSQQISVKGIVKDQIGEPVIGANVLVRGTTNGVITNVNGEFMLSDSVYYKMYLNDVRERGEADEAKMLELYTAVLQGDQSVVNAIVDGWLMRVIHMAGMYEDVPVNMEDLIQEGNMALWMALGALPELGSAPEVDKYLEGRVIAGFEAHIREVTGDTDQVQAVLGKAALLHEARKYLAKENAQDPSIRELSEYTHISPEEIQDILALQKEVGTSDGAN